MSRPTPPPSGLQPSAESMTSPRVAMTRWSVVARAASAMSEPQREAARSDLCRIYWYPMYVFLRRRGSSSSEAEDLVQGFFVELFEKNLLAAADPDRGRFRTFLLTSLTHYASHEHRREMALRRGGGQQIRSLVDIDADHRYASTAALSATPEAAFDRAWAMTLLNLVLDQLQQEYAERPEFFAALRPYLTADDGQVPYRETAERLGVDPLSIKVAVHRLRGRYRKLLDQQLMATVGDSSDLAEERAELFRALGG